MSTTTASFIDFYCFHCLTVFYVFFFHKSFSLSQTLITHKIAGEARGSSFILLYYFHPITKVHKFICNFACEMNIMYF